MIGKSGRECDRMRLRKGGSTSGPQGSRRRLGFFVLGTVVVSSLVAGFASSQIRSPAEIAARTAPPTPSVILVPVEERDLATKIVSRGTGRYGSPRNLAVAPSMLKEGERIITRLPRTGAVLAEGDVALSISGRPVFVLEGSQPAYRDLGPGMSGSDVKQLENALKRIGLDPGSVDGRYDSSTGDAVAALYRRGGYRSLMASDAQLSAVLPLEAELISGARAHGGVQFPADELVFVRAVPVRVAKVAAALGGRPSGTLLTVTDSVVAIDGSIPVEQAGLLKAGAKVVIDEPALGIKASGKVSRVATRPGTDGVDGFHVYFSVVVPKPPAVLVGSSVRLTVPIESTRETALSVPTSAVSLASDGTSRIQRSIDGVLEFITVEPGFSADGYVAITAVDAKLAAGDMVVVGIESSAAAPTGVPGA